MPDVIGDVIPLGVAVALSPVPLIATLLLVLAPVGTRGASLFLLARLASLSALTALFAWGSDLADDAAESTTPAAVLRLLVGSGLMAGAAFKWHRRPRRGDEPELPGWMHSIDAMGPGATLRLGVIITVANPKELAFAAGAGFTIGGAMLSTGNMVAAGTVFVMLACMSVAIPVAAVLVAGDRIDPVLAETRVWLVHNISMVLAIVLLVLGSILIGNGISELL